MLFLKGSVYIELLRIDLSKLMVICVPPLMHPPAGKLITFFDITPIPIAITPIPNIAFDLLLDRRDFICSL